MQEGKSRKRLKLAGRRKLSSSPLGRPWFRVARQRLGFWLVRLSTQAALRTLNSAPYYIPLANLCPLLPCTPLSPTSRALIERICLARPHDPPLPPLCTSLARRLLDSSVRFYFTCTRPTGTCGGNCCWCREEGERTAFRGGSLRGAKDCTREQQRRCRRSVRMGTGLCRGNAVSRGDQACTAQPTWGLSWRIACPALSTFYTPSRPSR